MPANVRLEVLGWNLIWSLRHPMAFLLGVVLCHLPCEVSEARFWSIPVDQFQLTSIIFNHFQWFSIALTQSKAQEFIDNRQLEGGGKQPYFPIFRSHTGKPNQRKAGSWTFRRGIPEQKFNVNRACFPEEKHQNSQKRAKFMNFLFWPFLWFGLPGRLLNFFSYFWPEAWKSLSSKRTGSYL